jgi:hypothetical protein
MTVGQRKPMHGLQVALLLISTAVSVSTQPGGPDPPIGGELRCVTRFTGTVLCVG